MTEQWTLDSVVIVRRKENRIDGGRGMAVQKFDIKN
jgi:hypothetical protein